MPRMKDVVTISENGEPVYSQVPFTPAEEAQAATEATAAVAAAIVYAASATVDRRVRTTDATPTEVYRRTLALLTGYAAVLNLLGVDAGNGAVRMIRASIVAKRLSNGAVLVGTPVVLANHQDAAATAWAITAAASGNDFVVTCTGAAGRTIDWLLSGEIRAFTPGGQP